MKSFRRTAALLLSLLLAASSLNVTGLRIYAAEKDINDEAILAEEVITDAADQSSTPDDEDAIASNEAAITDDAIVDNMAKKDPNIITDTNETKDEGNALSGSDELEAEGASPSELLVNGVNMLNHVDENVNADGTAVPLVGPAIPYMHYKDGVLFLHKITLDSATASCGIYCKGNLTVKVEGDCKIYLEGNKTENNYGIYMESGDLTLTSTTKGTLLKETRVAGTLQILGANDDNAKWVSSIFSKSGNITIKSPQTLGTTLSGVYDGFALECSPAYRYGEGAGEISASNGLVTIDDAAVDVYASKNDTYSAGIKCKNLVIESGEVYAYGCTSLGSVTGAETCAIWAEKSITIGEKAKVNASATEIGKNNTGTAVMASGKITVLGELTANGSTDAILAYTGSPGIILTNTFVSYPNDARVKETSDSEFKITDTQGNAVTYCTIEKGRYYNLWIGGTRISTNTLNAIPNIYPEGTATGTYDPDTNTLTLTGVKEIKMNGKNPVNTNGNPITSTIYSLQEISKLRGDATVSNSGPVLEAYRRALDIQGNFSFENTKSDSPRGMIAGNTTLTVDGEDTVLTVNGGKMAIQSDGFVLNDGQVTAVGTESGVYSDNDIKINGGKITAGGGKYAIVAYNHTFTLSNGETVNKPSGGSIGKDPADNKFTTVLNKDGAVATTARIVKKAIQLTVTVTATDRAYIKGDKSVTITNPVLTGVQSGDTVTADISAATAVMADDNAGTNKPVTVTGVKLTGTDAKKYALASQPEGVTVNIAKADWTNTSITKNDAKTGKAGTVDLSSALAPGGTYGTPVIKTGANQIEDGVTITSNKASWKAKSDIPALDLSFEVPVTGATNYNDYVVTVKVTSPHTHTTVAVPEVPATCENPGVKAHYICTFCEAEFMDSAAATPATDALLRIDPLGHDWDEGEIIEFPTATKDGKKLHRCKRPGCDATKEAVIAKGTPIAETGISIQVQDPAVTETTPGNYETVYTGTAIKPVIVVKNNGQRLVEGRDYTVKYSNNTKASSSKNATIQVNGKGSFTKNKQLSLKINKKDVGDADVIVGNLAYAEGKDPAPVVMYNGIELKANKDYTVQKLSDTAITIAGGGDNFTGTKTVSTAVKPAKNIRVVFGSINRTYDGTAQKLTSSELTVTDTNGSKLTENVGYIVSYSDNVNAGTVSVTVAGIGDYTGKATKKIKINPAKTAQFVVTTDKTDYEYLKAGVKPFITVKTTLNGTERTLLEGRDYKVSLSGNKKVGTGKFSLSFLGNYKGAKYTGNNTFTVKASNPAPENIKVIASDMVFKKSGNYKPKVWVIVNGELLKSSDYTVEYKTPKLVAAQNDLELTVKPKGTSYGFETQTAKYDVYPFDPEHPDKDITKGKVTLPSKSLEYSGLACKFDEGKISVKAGGHIISGDQLKNDCNFYYADNVEKGTATLIIKKNGTYYIGACQATFKITPEPFSN